MALRRTGCVGLLLLACCACSQAEDKIDFNRDIRPILAENCFACHGPDEKHREGGLRLDDRASAIAKLESGAMAITPNHAETSELIKRIAAPADDDSLMPPKKSGKKLTAKEKETLRRWIAEGAPFAAHWSFLKPVRSELPAVKNEKQVRNEIDRFLLARLEKDGLSFSPEASKETLLRRLSLDLIGLPPTTAEIDAFLADSSPEAYEKQVDRLLASPHYGERMAMLWLDFARYADSNGFQTDTSRQMWPWRDWVIRAFQENMPYDRFTIEQLAGDMLPNATRSQIAATGFNRNHRINGEGGIIGEEWRIENIIDRVETTGLTWMALTFNCCRCHDHKYDPITQKEFYQFFAFFNNVPESGTIVGDANRKGGNSDPLLRVPSLEQEAELARLEAALQPLQEAAGKAHTLVAAWQNEWEKQFVARIAEATSKSVWVRFEPKSVTSDDKKTTFTRQDDGTFLAGGPNPNLSIYTATGELPAPGKVSGILLETFPDPSLPNQSLGRYQNGNFVLSNVSVEVDPPGKKKVTQKAKLVRAEADYSQNGWEIGLILDAEAKNGWAVDGPTRRDPSKAMFLFEKPLEVKAGESLTVRLHHQALSGHNIGRFRLSYTSFEPSEVQLNGESGPPAGIREIVETPIDKRNAKQKETLTNYLKTLSEHPARAADAELAAAKKAISDINDSFPSVMIMKEMEKPRDAFLLERGQYDKPGAKVAAALPASLPPLPAEAKNDRLGLAQWLVSEEHPLTARVWVNRIWERLFGTGIVKSSENFGMQAEYPSHPELLDFLAVEFRKPSVMPSVSGKPAQAWDTKSLHKLMVMSAAYRQSSSVTPAMIERDPENRLLARGPRFRLSAEIIRDQALYASGLLVPKVGGPSVRPYMPEGVWDETSVYGDLLRYKHDSGEGLYRRTMYTIWKRTAAPPTMLMFDSPSREICAVKRARTNTPLQALSLLNEITFVEAARKLGERMISEGGATLEERITFAFRSVLTRRPTADELRILAAGHNRRAAKYKADPKNAEALAAAGESKSADTIDRAELAAYTLTANVILNLDETVTKE